MMRAWKLGWTAQRRWQRLARIGLLGVAALVFILPLAWTVLASFNIQPNDSASPPTWNWQPTVENYAEVGVAEPGFAWTLTTSTSLAALVTLLTITVGFLAAYSLVRSRFLGKALLVQSFLILASLPVMAYVIPLQDTVRYLRLYDTFIGVALAETAVYAPLAVYVLYGYLLQVSPELEEAAHLEGATLLQMLWQVALPIAIPGVAATAIIVFVLDWNLFLAPLVLTVNHVRTIPVAMSDFFTFERELEWPTAAAALVVSVLPLIVLVTIAHRMLEQFSLGAFRHDM
jgi:ABC-type glycerol-3-phosphate transport system permease component